MVLAMKASLVRSFGPASVLQIAEVPRPKPLPTEVVVRTRAIATNPVEAWIRAGLFTQVLPMEPPLVLGWDISGVVEEVVPGVTRFREGDEVFGMPLFPRSASGYAELVAAPSRQLARKPKGLGHAEAASLALAGLTAWQSLVDAADVRPGQRVLVHAAGGGVGHLAVQITKTLGAHVIATASAAKVDFVRGLGADEIIDYKATDFARAVKDVDVVLELVGRDYGTRSIEVLRKGGLLVSALPMNAQLAEVAEATIRAGRRFTKITVEPDSIGLERLASLVEDGKLRVHVSHRIPLEEAARAHALLESGSTIGKIVLVP